MPRSGSVIFLSLVRRGQRVPLRSSDLSMSCCSMEAVFAAAEATLSHRSAFWSTRCLACSSMRIPKRCLRRGRPLPRWPLSTCCSRVRPVTVARAIATKQRRFFLQLCRCGVDEL